MELKFFICKHCGNIITKLKDSGVPVVCCGENMHEIAASSTDASVEKHVPVVETQNNLVNIKVGSVEHPMTAEHYIEWVLLQTNKGFQIKYLQPLEKPETCFILNTNEKIENVYAYCNLHSLWKA